MISTFPCRPGNLRHDIPNSRSKGFPAHARKVYSFYVARGDDIENFRRDCPVNALIFRDDFGPEFDEAAHAFHRAAPLLPILAWAAAPHNDDHPVRGRGILRQFAQMPIEVATQPIGK
jgi:hypothetical protein